MNPTRLDARLTEDELDRLSTFLETLDDGMMNIEMLDGFFAAVLSGPENVPISEVLPTVWGENFEFESEEQATDMAGLVLRHWNAVVRALQESLDDPDAYSPVLFENDEGFVPANAWALGFMSGVDMRRDKWDPLMDDDELAWTLVPILMLTYEHDPDPEMRPATIEPESREELIDNMIAGALTIYRHFEPQRRVVVAPIRREGTKVGRNDPCPCGSGRKYKQCCEKGGAPKLH
jgi:uncharacterized protein